MDARNETAAPIQAERMSAPSERPRFTRGRLFALLGIAVVVVALIVGLDWLLVGSHHVSTDDAYVNADAADVTPLVSGPIVQAPATDTMTVKRGDVLVAIDPSDFKLAVAQAQAELGQAERQVEGYFASRDTQAAMTEAKAADVAHAKAQLASAHADARQRFIAAPVFGRPEAAAAAQLFIVVAGARSAFDDYAGLLGAMGQKLFYLGLEPTAANLVKLSGNFLIASVIESLGEAMALIGKAGIDPRTYLEVLTSTLFNVPLYKIYGGLIVDRQFEPAGFAAPLGLKDIRLTLAAAEQLQVAMPVASLLRDRFLTLLARGGQAQDWSAIARLAAADAGLPDGQ